MSDTATAVAANDPPKIDDGAKEECDQNSSKLFNKEKFSDLLIKFSGREIYAHRIILCQGCEYFDRLCGPDGHFAESKMKEITLHDDDPDALDAMFRHLYNFWLRPPSLSLSIPEKVHFYCNVVVVSDKYGLPTLADESRKSLNTFVVSIEDPETVLACLKIITDDYSDYKSLDDCAVNLAAPRLAELAAVTDFPRWLATQPQFLLGIVQDAAKLRTLTTLPLTRYKTIKKFKCTRASCGRFLLDRGEDVPRCHGSPASPDGVVYYDDS